MVPEGAAVLRTLAIYGCTSNACALRDAKVHYSSVEIFMVAVHA